jgi:hypothetical protein
MPNLIRVAIVPNTPTESVHYGVFHGLVSNAQGCERCDSDGYACAVTLDGEGMIVRLYHPSRVVLNIDRAYEVS